MLYLLNEQSTHAAFYCYHSSSMSQTNGQSSIVQQPGAFLKQLIIV